jgi:hypothetical protein
MKYNKVSVDWWELIDENQKVGWVRLTAIHICDKKHCNMDSNKCRIIKTIPKYAVWLYNKPMVLTNTLEEALKIMN